MESCASGNEPEHNDYFRFTSGTIRLMKKPRRRNNDVSPRLNSKSSDGPQNVLRPKKRARPNNDMVDSGSGPLFMGLENQLDLNSLPSANNSLNHPMERVSETVIEDTARGILQEHSQEDETI
ncbi:hypothetical protein R6Q59_001615 [Mikania micrantha]